MKKIILLSVLWSVFYSCSLAQFSRPVKGITIQGHCTGQFHKVYCNTFTPTGRKSDPFPDKQYYLAKSKNQKTIAWVLLGGGVAMTSIGIILARNKIAHEKDPITALLDIAGVNTIGYYVLSSFGVAATLGSIPLFIASARNKRKAGLAISNQKTGFGIPATKNGKMACLTLLFPVGK